MGLLYLTTDIHFPDIKLSNLLRVTFLSIKIIIQQKLSQIL